MNNCFYLKSSRPCLCQWPIDKGNKCLDLLPRPRERWRVTSALDLCIGLTEAFLRLCDSPSSPFIYSLLPCLSQMFIARALLPNPPVCAGLVAPCQSWPCRSPSCHSTHHGFCIMFRKVTYKQEVWTVTWFLGVLYNNFGWLLFNDYFFFLNVFKYIPLKFMEEMHVGINYFMWKYFRGNLTPYHVK